MRRACFLDAMSPVETVAVVHASVAGAFTALCCVATLLYYRSGRASSLRPRVVLLRPVEEVTAALAARLEQDVLAYSGELHRVVCAAGSVRAAPGVIAAASGLSDDAAVNRKAAHLEAGLKAARRVIDADTVVVHADSDVVLSPGDLDALVGALPPGDARCLAFAPPAATGGTPLSVALAQSIVSLSPQSFTVIAALARFTGAAPAIAGKLVAIPAPLLDAVGGYACMMHAIGDDVALVAAVRRVGGRVVMSPLAAVTSQPRRTTRAVWAQLSRWLRVVGWHRPRLLLTYPVFIAPLAVALPLAVAAHTAASWCALSWLLAMRAVLAGVLATGPYRGRVKWASVAVAVVGDALLVFAALLALTSRRVTWSGRTYRIGSGGRIAAVEFNQQPR